MESSRADWDLNPIVGDQKLGKCEGGIQGFGTPILKWRKQGARCKKPFDNLMGVSGSKLDFSTVRLKNGLNNVFLMVALCKIYYFKENQKLSIINFLQGL